MRDHTPYELIVRRFSGTATAREAAALEAWLAKDQPRRRAELERLRTVWEEIGALPAPRRSRDAWARIAPRLAATPLQPPLIVAPRRWVTGVIAAALTGAAAAGVVLWTATRGPGPLVTYATTRGQRAVVRFADGTTITLAPESRLEVPQRNSRALRLDGEALFDVAHDPRHPFTVRAGHTIIRDVGTRFVVDAYAADARVRVAVSGGQVALGALALGPGEAASITAAGVTTVEHGVDVASLAAWSTGVVRFRNAPLPDVVRELARWYDVRFVLTDSQVARRRLTAEFTSDQSAADVVAAIALVSHARVQRQMGGGFLLMDAR